MTLEKWIYTVAIGGIVIALSVAACSPRTEAKADVPQEPVQTVGPDSELPSENVRSFTDSNGCQYLVFGKYIRSLPQAVTPRMRPDGKQECGQ